MFIPDEMSDLEQLFWRLTQGQGLMASVPPLPQYRSSQGLDFHSMVIMFCLERNLQYLLYVYLQHYRCLRTSCGNADSAFTPTLSYMFLTRHSLNSFSLHVSKHSSQSGDGSFINSESASDFYVLFLALMASAFSL